MAPSTDLVVLRINIPSLKLQKAIRVNGTDHLWSLKKQLEDKVQSEIKDILNYGLYLHGKDGKQGKFLDERNTVGSYHLDTNCLIDFQLKCKIRGDTDTKKQRKMFEDVQKGNIEKVKERTTKDFDFNYVIEQDTPIATATMNNDPAMIMWLMDSGAFLDFRVGDRDNWKTPLHLAALHNKTLAIKVFNTHETLIQFGAWVNSQDTLGLTPLYYAASGGNSECVIRLLLAKADTEIFDEHGRGPLHIVYNINKAALNNHDCIVALLLDSGANMHATNVGGNTPLHVAASRNSKESTRWLLLRGSNQETKNKSGKTPFEVGIQASCAEVCEIISKFKQTSYIPPPTRLNIEISETEGVVQNVLTSLSASIGREYTPQQLMVKRSSKPVSMVKKVLGDQGDSFSSLPSDDGKSTRKSMAIPRPPNSMLIVNNGARSTSSIGSPLDGSTNRVTSLLSTGSSIGLMSNEQRVASVIIEKGDAFDTAWQKLSPTKNHEISRLRTYFNDLASGSDGNVPMRDLLTGLENIERGFVKAISKWEEVDRENESLLKRLKVLEMK